MVPVIWKQVEGYSHLIEFLGCEFLLERALIWQEKFQNGTFVIHDESREYGSDDGIVLIPADQVRVSARRNQCLATRFRVMLFFFWPWPLAASSNMRTKGDFERSVRLRSMAIIRRKVMSSNGKRFIAEAGLKQRIIRIRCVMLAGKGHNILLEDRVT